MHKLQPNFNLFNLFKLVDTKLFSFITALNSSARSRNLLLGRHLHASITKSLNPHTFIKLHNALIHMYCACGDLNSAHQLFDEMPPLTDAVSWSTLINGYSRGVGRRPDMAFALFREMMRRRSSSGVEVNETMVVSLLSCSSSVSQRGEPVHGFCVKCGMCKHVIVVTAIVNMYVKSERLAEARRAFEETGSTSTRKDVVLYNCMVDGYAKSGCLEECLSLLQRMEDEGITMNSSTLVGLLAACASAGALAVGQRVHEIARSENLDPDASLGTAILDMYVKCGCIGEALQVFRDIRNKDVTAWTAMIMGLGIHGRVEEALRMFQEMEVAGVRPNEVTFLAVLNACSHGGVVGLGKDLFKKMVVEYAMSPGIKHYGCIVDLLGRAGMLEEAHRLIKNLPSGGDATAWRALLAACRVHGDVRIGLIAQEALVGLGDRHPTDSILLTSAYAFSGKWADVGRMRELEARAAKTMSKKEAGRSSVDMSGNDQEFRGYVRV